MTFSHQSGKSRVFQLASEIRGVSGWNSLGIDLQADSLLRLPFFLEHLKVGSPDPVPYKKGKPGPEHCDSEGRCWRFNPAQPGSSSPFLVHDSWVLSSREIGTHWLPHDAPSLPTNFKVDPAS